MKMNRKGRRAEKFRQVGVERGYGPRHAMNAQEGSEAVPSALPEPPVEDLRVRPNSMGNLRPAMLLKALGEELGGLSKEDVAKIGISLLVGGEGELPLPKGGVPKVEPLVKGKTDKEIIAENLFSADKYGLGVEKPKKLHVLPGLGGLESGQPPPLPPEGFAKGTKGVRKFRGYSPVRAAGGEAEHTKVSVEKGFGPRHAANAKEGDGVDLTKINTDTVPAVLTPREAVLNRNAAEMAGRGNIEALNKKGNMLASKGVDLAARGETSVRSEVMKSKPKQSSNEVPAYGKLPSPPQAQPSKGGGFYPPGHGPFGMAEGDAEVPGGIGRPNPQMAYDPRAQVDFKGPDLSGFLRDMAAEAKKRGISEAQMAGIAKQFAGMGGGGNAGAPGTGILTTNDGMTYPMTGGYQGGISEIGYPPMLMPNAEYHADKGSTWEGAYDPQFLVQRYAAGTSGVDFDYIPPWAEPTPIPGNTGPRGFGRPSTMAGGGDHSGYNNRSSWGGGQPGMPWSPTVIPTTYDPQGYPFAVPVQGPDQNLQGVGRTHNLRKNQ